MAENVTGRTATVDPYAHIPLAMDEEEKSVDFAALFHTLRRARNTVFGITVATCLLAVAIAYLLPVKYTSTVSFIPPALSNSSMASTIAGQLSSVGGEALFGASKGTGDLYAGILASRSIAEQLVDKFHLKDVYKVSKESLAEKELASNTAVTVDMKSTIVTVDVTDKSPERARDIANAYMAALRDTNGRLALGQSSQRRLFFGEQLAKEKDDLENAEVEMKKTEEQSGLIAPSGQTEAEIKTIADLQAQIAVRDVQLASLRQSATEQNPDVIRLHSEIGDLQGQLARLQKGGGSSIAAIPTSKVPELQLEYVRKEREVKYHEALFDMLSKQYEAARMDEARDAPVLQVLDPASLPDSKSSPKRMMIMIGGFVLGLFGGSIWVLVRDPVRELRATLAGRETI